MLQDVDVKKQRSYSGCSRCKRRRQKCDEGKPQCGRCIEARGLCEYSVKLRWGGRSFDRSRFGQCLKGVERIGGGDVNANEFVYTSTTSLRKIDPDYLLPRELSFIPSLSNTEKALLHHFTDEGSRVTCCNANVQQELCHLVIPMALESPSLMYATLAWSATQSVAFRGAIEDVPDTVQFIAKLKAKSIEQLRRELQDPNLSSSDALLATVRTLCQCEIHSGSDGGSAWRVHVKGAKALMGAVQQGKRHKAAIPRLLYRWYGALDSLAALASWGHASTECSNAQEPLQEPTIDVYLDDYNGYSTDLSLILGKIGAAVAVGRQKHLPASTIELESQAASLESSIYRIMERDNSRSPIFYPGVIEKLSAQTIQEYALCNEAYQHTALIHVLRQLRNLPCLHSQVQRSVKRIIECVRSITPLSGLSPAIVLTTPLFTAGCEALKEDRVVIRGLLTRLYEMLRIRNIRVTLEVLENYWSCDGEDGDLERLLRERNWDFIPY